jgi:hypothetical protein
MNCRFDTVEHYCIDTTNLKCGTANHFVIDEILIIAMWQADKFMGVAGECFIWFSFALEYYILTGRKVCKNPENSLGLIKEIYV